MAIAGAMQPYLFSIDVGEDHFVDTVVVIRIVRGILEIEFQLAGIGIKSQRGVGIEIVARPHVTIEVRPWIPDWPVENIAGRIVGPSDPGGPTPILVGFSAPAVRPRLAGRRYRVGLPNLLAGIGIAGGDVPSYPIFGPRSADDDLAVKRHRHKGQTFSICIVADLLVPDDFAGVIVQSDKMGIQGRKIDLILVQGDATVNDITAEF